MQGIIARTTSFFLFQATKSLTIPLCNPPGLVDILLRGEDHLEGIVRVTVEVYERGIYHWKEVTWYNTIVLRIVGILLVLRMLSPNSVFRDAALLWIKAV